jgi:hypothetical protein
MTQPDSHASTGKAGFRGIIKKIFQTKVQLLEI